PAPSGSPTSSHRVRPFAPRPAPTASASPAKPLCDEVSCLLDDYAGPCCAKFKKKPQTAPSGSSAGSADGALPESLDRAMISASVAAVRPRIAACADNSSAKGRVKVHVRVGSDGTVTSTSV